MKYKRITMLAIFLVCLLAISAVSAADSAASDTAGIDNTNIIGVESDSDSAYSPLTATDNDENNVLADSQKTFKDLNEIINGNESASIILLDDDYVFNSTTDSGFETGIVINRSVTICGNDIVLDGANSARIFNITGDGVVLKGITFANGKILNGNGGAIYWSGNHADVSDCYFVNNYAIMGGAIYFSDELNDSNIDATFINNTANGTGGANFFMSPLTNVNITGTFTNNTANADGGANDFEDTLNNVNIKGTFTNNKADGSGGANYFYGALDNVNITGDFTSNIANDWDGGACPGRVFIQQL